MPRYRLDYVNAAGSRVSNLLDAEFDDLAKARHEALVIIHDLLRDGIQELGAVEICDETGCCVMELHLPAM